MAHDGPNMRSSVVHDTPDRTAGAAQRRQPDAGVTAPPEPRRAARVACFMMQKNEQTLLDLWLRYHAHIFGAENLFVLDNGSSLPDVKQRLRQAEAEGVTVLWEYNQKEHFETKGKLFRNLMWQLPLDEFDFVMPMDCDEFVAHQALDGTISCDPEAVTGYLAEKHRGDPRVLVIRGSYFNVPGQPASYFFAGERKCFFAHGMVKALGMGFHQGTSRKSDIEVRTEIVHFHYRYKPFEMFDAHAREKLAARVNQFEADQIKGYKGKGSHLARFLAMGEESYARYFRRFDRMPISSLRAAMRKLGTDLPY